MIDARLFLLAVGLALASCDNSYDEADDDTTVPADDDTIGDDDAATDDDDDDHTPGDDDDTFDPGPSLPVELAGAETEGCYAHVAAYSWDRVMVAWESDGTAIHYACFDGASWTAAAPVHGDSGAENNPWLDVDSQGHFHMVWSHGLGSGREIHYATYTGACADGSWSTPEVITTTDPYTGCSSCYPSLGVDENDVPYATWSQATVPTTDPYCDTDDDCPPGYDCVEESHVCKPYQYEPHFARRLGGAWEVPTAIHEDPTALTHHGSLHVASSTEVHAAYHYRNGSQGIYHASFDGQAWSEHSFTGIGDHVGDVRSDGTNVHVFTNTSDHAHRPLSGGGWTVEQVGSGGDISFISIRLGPDNSLHVVWCWGPDSGGHRVWYARKDPAGAWSEPARVTDDLPRFTEPSLDVDPDGYAHIVWTYCAADGCDWDVEHGAIWYVRTTLEDLQGS